MGKTTRVRIARRLLSRSREAEVQGAYYSKPYGVSDTIESHTTEEDA